MISRIDNGDSAVIKHNMEILKLSSCYRTHYYLHGGRNHKKHVRSFVFTTAPNMFSHLQIVNTLSTGRALQFPKYGHDQNIR
jgi:hypothetical protein